MIGNTLEKYKKRNATGFIIQHASFGNLFFGHVDPIHKEKNVREQILPIFKKCNIIIGDLNAGWHRLTSRNKYNNAPLVSGKFGYVYNPVSYLTPVQPNQMDARIDMIISKNIRPLPVDVGITFDAFSKYQSPRDLMKDTGFPSDHRPIKALITNPKDNCKITVAFWNVADPVFWSQFYSGSAIGFDMGSEDKRLDSVLQWAESLIADSDILGLAEVPLCLIPKLQILAKKFKMNFEHLSEHSNIWRPYFPVSQMVLIYK